MKVTSLEIKPLACPFCGHPVDLSDPDTLYPNGTSWREMIEYPGLSEYVRTIDFPDANKCYSLHCVTSSGGCGVEMPGDSIEECFLKWCIRGGVL
jgi:hypothetical protein